MGLDFLLVLDCRGPSGSIDDKPTALGKHVYNEIAPGLEESVKNRWFLAIFVLIIVRALRMPKAITGIHGLSANQGENTIKMLF